MSEDKGSIPGPTQLDGPRAAIPKFRDFYVERNQQRFGDTYPCPLGTSWVQLGNVMADSIADYMDLLAEQVRTI